MPGDLIPQDGKIKVTGAAVRSARSPGGVGIPVGGDLGRAPHSHAIPRSGITAPTARRTGSSRPVPGTMQPRRRVHAAVAEDARITIVGIALPRPAPIVGFPAPVLAPHRPYVPDAATMIRRPGESTSVKTLSCGEAPQGTGAFKT
ncbi:MULTISPECIES: hypothetical protein [Methylobacterium]|uniref:hypothetical protein n=1 Tax=Methylobacterium TaxID=407 RepID=UPI0011144C34|nr:MULTISPECIES: hypothetical protein [Methylobacterium]MBK3400619.1 hypothetical protein [Methylobacterium ajmalii]MBK3407044.1 hypothetical protein [Methylobacterium ajmalii]MBK3425259.1 hypothetical protein [Methylobacterium ajmalii]MBZ6412304.1 hypothetical protein [Methylobacterium sp.]